MRVEKVAQQEEQFAQTLTNANGAKYKLITKIPMKTKSITVIRPSFDTYFYQEETKKNKIVLHYTIGHLKGDMATLTKKDYHVSVPYLIARDGTVYELFNPELWAYHLGNGTVGGNKAMSKDSIGIELSNYGPLTLSDDEKSLLTAYSSDTRKDIYCDADQGEYYEKVDPTFKGYSHFATFTEAQYTSLNELLKYLCKRFDIPNNLLPIEKRYKTLTSQEVKPFRGICSHVNFRTSGKTDIGIAFDWNKIIDKRVFAIDLGQMPKANANKHMEKEISVAHEYNSTTGTLKSHIPLEDDTKEIPLDMPEPPENEDVRTFTDGTSISIWRRIFNFFKNR